MSDVIITKINAKPNTIFRGNKTEGRLRVAAYARVSTDKDEQEDSFERQVEYYTEYIQSNDNWNFVKIYSDPGISGTRADKRPGFQELMKDCREGKIDKVLCKSIARFSRNTVDALNYIRELKDLGIGVMFETQNIDTSTPGGDVLLTILAATAEEESRTISKNIKWAMQKKFEKGDFMLNYNRFMGYTRDENHNLVIVPEEAEVVVRMYKEYVNGASTNQIAKNLERDGILSPTGNKKWHESTVLSMLKNEKYAGNALMMKTYLPDVISKKRIKNEGQCEQYYAEHTHPAIISPELFQAAQDEMARRHKIRVDHPQHRGLVSTRYPFSQKIRCGVCGAQYTRQQIYSNGEMVPAWWCYSRRRSQKLCSQRGISEKSIENGFVMCLKEVFSNIEEIKEFIETTVVSTIVEAPMNELEDINLEISNLQKEMMDLHTKKTLGKIIPDAYAKQGSKLADKIDALKKRKEDILFKDATNRETRRRVNEIREVIKSFNPTNEFDPNLFKKLIDEITVNDRNKLTFKFKIGISKTIIVPIK